MRSFKKHVYYLTRFGRFEVSLSPDMILVCEGTQCLVRKADLLRECASFHEYNQRVSL